MRLRETALRPAQDPPESALRVLCGECTHHAFKACKQAVRHCSHLEYNLYNVLVFKRVFQAHLLDVADTCQQATQGWLQDHHEPVAKEP